MSAGQRLASSLDLPLAPVAWLEDGFTCVEVDLEDPRESNGTWPMICRTAVPSGSIRTRSVPTSRNPSPVAAR